MGNHIAILYWISTEKDADIVRKFSEIRQRLGIDIDEYGERPGKTALPSRDMCHVSGDVSSGLSTFYKDHKAIANQWLTECQRFVSDNPRYCGNLSPKDIKLELIYLPM